MSSKDQIALFMFRIRCKWSALQLRTEKAFWACIGRELRLISWNNVKHPISDSSDTLIHGPRSLVTWFVWNYSIGFRRFRLELRSLESIRVKREKEVAEIQSSLLDAIRSDLNALAEREPK